MAAIGLFLIGIGRRTRIWLRVLGAVLYAVVAAALAAVMLDATSVRSPGHPGALFGDAVMIAGTVILSVVALHGLLGLPGTGIAVGALFVVGNAVNGSAVRTCLLPDVYRQIAPWMPNNAGIHRSDLYFGGHGQGRPLLTLLIWLAVAIAILLATDLIHLRLRHATPDQAPAIYATSLLDHLRTRRNPVRHREHRDARQDPGRDPTLPPAESAATV